MNIAAVSQVEVRPCKIAMVGQVRIYPSSCSALVLRMQVCLVKEKYNVVGNMIAR